MITKSTIQIWLLPIKLSSTIPLFLSLPFEVVGFRMRSSSNPITLQKSRRFKFYVAHILGQFCVKFCMQFYTIYAYWAMRTENPLQFHRDLFPIVHVGSISVTTTFLQVYMVRNYKDFLRQARYCLRICLELDDDTRAVSLVMGLACFAAAFGVPAIGVGFFVLLEGGVLFQPFQTSYSATNALLVLVNLHLLETDVLLVFYYMFSGIMQTVLISKSLSRFTWTAPTTYEERELLRKKYQFYFLVNRDDQLTWAPIILAVFTSGVLVIITAFYIVIRYHGTANPFFVLTMAMEGGGLCIGMAIFISYAISIREACLNYAHSFLKYETQLRPHEKKWFLNACQPIEFQVGNFFALTTGTFFLVVMSFIVENVIDLLVMFGK